ncbi:MAG: hypothetical protein IPO02_10465 [Bacteroidetes bacterium]|nr:hypothetical protein [Bacteroidota bacterium]
MPGVDKSGPLVGVGAGASNDFANAEANAGIDFLASAELKRGFKTDIGITAFTNASAGISKFVAASIEGTAFASARAGIQGQLALNLFKEFGFIVKAEAVAEAAAGVKANLGINIGDFIQLALQDKNNHGLPIELLIMLLEEVEIGGAFYIDVSVSAKAHCTISLSGTLLPKPGEKAGFKFMTKAGVGLAKGVGMSFKAGIGFKDFRRFYGRAVDRTIDEVILQIDSQLPPQAKVIMPYLNAFAPLAKMSLRMSYDIGEKIIINNIGKSSDDAQALCNECIKIIVEEVQRFSFEKIAAYALNALKQRVVDLLSDMTDDVWTKLKKERHELADLLSKFPNEPFQPTLENATYWKDFILKTISLLQKLFITVTFDEKLIEQMTILYCSAELSIEAIRAKVNKASAYTVVAGVGTTQVNNEPFKGLLDPQPPPLIKEALNTTLGRALDTDIDYTDLLEYLVDDVLIDQLLKQIPAMKAFMDIFKDDFNHSEREVLKLFLNSVGAFIQDEHGITMPKDTLSVMVRSIDKFMTDKFKHVVLVEINKYITDPTLKSYLDEVFLTCVIYTKDVALKAALEWETKPYTNDDFTEALAGVMMMFLGRTVVLMSDTLLTAAQNEVKTLFEGVAIKIESNHRDIAPLRPLLQNDEAKQLVVDILRVGAEVLGPLPDDKRKRLRLSLYQIFEVMRPGEEKELLEELSNQLFIPNFKDIESLTKELAEIAKYRFGLFAEKILLTLGKFILEELEALFLFLTDLIIHWEKNLADALIAIAAALKSIDVQLNALNTAMLSQYQRLQTSYDRFIAKLNSTEIKNVVKGEMVKRFVATAELLLKDQQAYKLLPRNAKTLAENQLRTAVAALLDNPVLIPIFNSINAIGQELEGLMPEAKRLNPNHHLGEQFLDLVLDKIEEKIRRHFRSTKPSIQVSIRFSYTIPEVIVTPAVHIPAKVITPAIHIPAKVITPAVIVNGVVVVPAIISPAINTPAVMSPAVHIPAVTTPAQTIRVNIPLGKIELNLDPFIIALRDAISASNFYHDAMNQVVINLAGYLAKVTEVAIKELQKMDTQKRQSSIYKIAQELTSSPKEIKIITPLQFIKYQHEVPVEIQLKNVHASYLGLNEDEIQRVFIFVNGVGIAPSSLKATEISTVLQRKVPLTTFRFNIKTNQLILGLNFLTVAIIDMNGVMQQQLVRFLYTPQNKPVMENMITQLKRKNINQQLAEIKKVAGEQHLSTFKNIIK